MTQVLITAAAFGLGVFAAPSIFNAWINYMYKMERHVIRVPPDRVLVYFELGENDEQPGLHVGTIGGRPLPNQPFPYDDAMHAVHTHLERQAAHLRAQEKL